MEFYAFFWAPRRALYACVGGEYNVASVPVCLLVVTSQVGNRGKWRREAGRGLE